MDYDKAVESGGPSYPIKGYFYERYFLPYLKESPAPVHFIYLLDQAWTAEKIKIREEDLRNMQFLSWICRQLAEEREEKFAELSSSLLEESHDTNMRTEGAERNLYNSYGSSDNVRIYSDLNRFYKVLYENELRLWSTIPYAYIVKLKSKKYHNIDVRELILIGAGKKFRAIKNFKISTLYGDINDLVDGFSSDLRNAGEGHDSWEVMDDGKILFKLVNPYTGKERGSGQIILTNREYHDIIEKCRRSLWILKNGLIVFLVNNPSITKDAQSSKTYKIREIESHLRLFAEECGVNLEKFSADENRSLFKIEIKHRRQIVGKDGKLFIGQQAAFDIVNIKIELSYKLQSLRLIQMFVYNFYAEDNLPRIEISVFDENDALVGEAEYLPNELKKLFLPFRSENIPIPNSGDIPDRKFDVFIEHRVPYGEGKTMQEKIDEHLAFDRSLLKKPPP